MGDRRTGSARTGTRVLAAGAGGLLVALALPATAAVAAPGGGGPHGGGGCEHRSNNTYDKLLECMTLEGVMEHLQALQDIATKSDDPVYPGTRAAGTEGYAASVEYVSSLLEDAGYEVTLDPVEITFNFPAELRQLTPVEADYETGVFTGSGSGEVEGQVYAIDINLETGEDAVSTSGCEPEDFAGFDWSGTADIALVQRGTCFFGTKAYYAEQAGAEAVVIFNQGNTPEREELIVADATSVDEPIPGAPGPVTHGIPVVGASYADGVALAEEGSTAYVNVLPAETRTDYNVIAELPGKNPDNVVMAGAHLDSVTEGPGINDDGSGTAALLETALLMANSHPQNTLRFGFWAAEEQGLVGSTDYVEGLSQAEQDRIALYMNYDMIGSPNYIFMVYDADESTFPAPEGVTIPEGSEAIEDVYESYYTLVGEPYDDTAFDARSDYQAFIEAGIPAGGLFTGAEVLKTEAQVAIWGGTAGEQFDPCYHEACDDITNLDEHALEVNSDLVAFAMLTFAYSTESVNGVPGKRVPGRPFELPAPAGPEGTFAEEGGGLGHQHAA
ncbi:PA domain-containing protein [Geodermatophilus saharensis]|uniref:PA domain-containing protein n=1 Tax=Geodermatophilus saharensis TaxID=1137994 RepID=A0A238ZU23_9ACTN|nr:M28 family metallopeptidase [Geodermatophilus saharensis]SNR86835.1 PA domain-containing protein [Geodermatophilus saharensis]